jgi:tRNA pseudouridine55 synthase
MDSLFVANKPLFISSNHYLNRLKRKYKTKKMGFSGTLDPFATGTLVIATGAYTKLLRFLDKAPKRYSATIWLGAISDSFDIENIQEIKDHKKLDKNRIVNTLNSLLGDITYTPPKYSAKKIDGKRAYELARANQDIKLKEITSTISEINFINYNHPFISFDITVSEGSYIRSLAQIILDRLDSVGTLSYLKRESEGKFSFKNEEKLDTMSHLKLEKNIYHGDMMDFFYGKKLIIDDFKFRKDGVYVVEFDDFFAIIELENKSVSYMLNKVKRC